MPSLPSIGVLFSTISAAAPVAVRMDGKPRVLVCSFCVPAAESCAGSAAFTFMLAAGEVPACILGG